MAATLSEPLRDVRILPDRDVKRPAVLAALTRRDVLVVFDYRRFESDETTMAALVQEQGGKVVPFTDTRLSPVAPQRRGRASELGH
ncbi:SIS domain-containing protein [Streptomyces microflavus]|uniref:SIS domain-containing protein n=1 Tax=Streptomyces microflavus TaxID=1919 RepID=UPI0033F2EEBF